MSTRSTHRPQILEDGRFVIQVGGQPVGREEFALARLLDGFLLVSNVNLNLGGRSERIASALQLDKVFRPLAYSVNADLPVEGNVAAAVEFQENTALVHHRAGAKDEERKLVSHLGWAVLDSDTFSQFAVLAKQLLRLGRQQKLERTAVTPLMLTTIELKLVHGQPITIASGSRESTNDSLVLTFGLDVLLLLMQQNMLIGVVPQGTKVPLAYRGDLWPKGFVLK